MSAASDLRSSLPKLTATFRRFAPQLRPQRTVVAGGMVALFAEIGLRLLEPWPLKLIVDRLVAPAGGEAASGIGWADGLDAQTLLVGAAVAVVVITALRALAAYLWTVAFAIAGNRVLTEVRADLYRHLQRLSLSFHSQARGGDLLTRITGDVGRLQEVSTTAVLPLLGNAITLVGMVAVMTWRSPSLTLVACSAFPVFAFTMVRLSKRIKKVARSQRKQEGELASVTSESLGAMKVVQSYSLEEVLGRSFATSNQRSMTEGVKGKRLSAGLERRTDVLVAVSTGLVLYYGSQQVLAGRLTPGDLILFLTYLKNAFKPLRDVAKYTARLAKAAASSERIMALLDTAPDITDQPGAREARRLRGSVRFEGVTFGYDDDHPVVKDLDLLVRPGQRVAIVGPSGAGKSSLLSLIPRLYEPQRGRVLLDFVDVRELTLQSVRSQVGIVLQESVLFATTVRENIGYGVVGATDAEIERAARLAHAHHFITALPDGYDTVLSERGASLSGGQRQRIAIARAAVRDAPIVLLDEPTTGLDGQSEADVTQALEELTKGRTTFLVAHDLRTVVDADLILFLDGGRVVERGDHESLVAAGGRYAALWRLQEQVGAVGKEHVVADAG